MFKRAGASGWVAALALSLPSYGCGGGGGGGAGSGASSGNVGASGDLGASAGAGSGTNAGVSAGAGTGMGAGVSAGVSAGATAASAGASSGAGVSAGATAASTGASSGAGTGASSGAGAGAGTSTGAGAGAGTSTGASSGSDSDASVASGSMGDAGPAQPFACTELIGLWVASQWWPSFYKDINDPAHWQFMFQHHGYLEDFADPASPYWANAIINPCPGTKAPDRVVFLPYSLTLMTLADWQTQLTMVVQTIKGKFPGVRRIELFTSLRAPGKMICANDPYPGTVVPAYVDQAIQTVADQSGGLVTVGPELAAADCSWFAGMDDLTGAGNTGAGKLYADYYNTHP